MLEYISGLCAKHVNIPAYNHKARRCSTQSGSWEGPGVLARGLVSIPSQCSGFG